MDKELKYLVVIKAHGKDYACCVIAPHSRDAVIKALKITNLYFDDRLEIYVKHFKDDEIWETKDGIST
jgi:hypothetical protein